MLGAVAATARKSVSETLMRVLDIIMSFPGIALAAVFVSVFGRSLPVLVLTIAFLYTPQLTRVVRANILDQYGEDYVAATRVMGARTAWILAKHVARNCAAPVLVFTTVLVADAIVFEASLSFIQAGVPDPEPSWGNIIAAGRDLVMGGYWWATFFPGLAIMLTVLCLNILSEGMTDAMVAAPRATRATPAKAVATDSDDAAVAAELTAMDADEPVETPDEARLAESEPVVPDVEPEVTHVGRAVPLATRLATLRAAESARTDRPVYDGDAEPLLEVRNLSIRFPRHGDVAVVDDVSFSVRPGETMALVGESGCGKSITSLAVMGLLDPSAQISGEIRYGGKDLLAMGNRERASLRGTEIAMIYQDALSSLNPSMLIRAQMKQLTRRGGTRTAEELLELVGLDPERTLKSYPHELSGGQRQRVLIAMALTRDPKLVIADEPTTALDVTVQAQVVALLDELRVKLGFAMVFVSHDLALVAQIAHRITVMYAGQVVEQAPTSELLTDPATSTRRGCSARCSRSSSAPRACTRSPAPSRHRATSRRATGSRRARRAPTAASTCGPCCAPWTPTGSTSSRCRRTSRSAPSRAVAPPRSPPEGRDERHRPDPARRGAGVRDRPRHPRRRAARRARRLQGPHGHALQGQPRARRERRQRRGAPRQHARDRRRVRLGQVDHGEGARRAAGADVRRDPLPRAAGRHVHDARAARGRAGRPSVVFRTRPPRSTPACARGTRCATRSTCTASATPRRARRASASSCTSSGCPSRRSTRCPASSPAGSGSASRSRAPSRSRPT